MIRFRRFYAEVQEGGYVADSIIAYNSSPSLFSTKCYEDGKCESIVIEYKRYLRIDLYFAILEFKWTKKIL